MCAILLISCNNNADKKEEAMAPELKEENIRYKLDSLTMDGYIVYMSGGE